MNNEVQSDMTWSSKLFNEQVWPLCLPYLGKGQLIQMEGRPDTELANLLDMHSGIDAWHMHPVHGLRGIASRVQTGMAYNTFTVRLRRDTGAVTEFDKRKNAIESNGGWIYPKIAIQAYAKLRVGPILSVGIAYTEDIIRFIEKGMHITKQTTNATFAVCDWSKMQSVGYRVQVITPANSNNSEAAA